MTTNAENAASSDIVDIVQDPAIAEIRISEAQLQARVCELADALSADYAGKCPVLVGILRGSIMFLADLLRYLDMPLEIDFLAISSYVGRDSSGVVRLLKDLDRSITGKHVVLVEDIIDTGLTLNYVLRILRARAPASLEVCSLLDKPARRLVEQQIKYVGFHIPDVFVVGYGLDYNQRYRNLPFIGSLRMP
ncbi:MAG: hypoxanthine phosphoribosyltransferase [Chloroflexi bacterium]|nr:hypoxanthine phosphoribosyltransferase [Chloroflexota bacterium]